MLGIVDGLKYLPPFKNHRGKLKNKSYSHNKNNNGDYGNNNGFHYNNNTDGNSHQSMLNRGHKSDLEICSDSVNSNVHSQLFSTANREDGFENGDINGFDVSRSSQINTAQNTEPSSNETEKEESKIIEFNVESSRNTVFPRSNNRFFSEILPQNYSSQISTVDNILNEKILFLEKNIENVGNQGMEKCNENKLNIDSIVSTNPFDSPPKVVDNSVENIDKENDNNHSKDNDNYYVRQKTNSNDNNDNDNNNDNSSDKSNTYRKLENSHEKNKTNDNTYNKVIIEKSNPCNNMMTLNNAIENNKNTKLFESQNPKKMSTLPRHHPMASSYFEFVWKKILFLLLSSSCVLFFWILQFPQIFGFSFENYENKKSVVSILSCAFGFIVSACTATWLIMILNVSGSNLVSFLISCLLIFFLYFDVPQSN